MYDKLEPVWPSSMLHQDRLIVEIQLEIFAPTHVVDCLNL
jgi:hypothetical protein